MKILLFGKTGQVAQEICTQATPQLEITALPRAVADLADPQACAAQIADTDADVVINAAAYTAVDHAETDEANATVINGDSPGAMARAAAKRALPFLHISTDYVFDGGGTDPRHPSEPTAPLNAYGRSKLAGEHAVQAAGGQTAILRTSWVFSRHGSNFVKTMLRLSESRDTLSVVGDQIGGPTPAADIASALISMAQAMHRGEPAGQHGGVYHFGGTPAVSWADFARETFRLAGRCVSVHDIPTSAYPTPAPRPLNSRLDCASLETDFGITPPDWKAGLARVIRNLETKTP